MDRRRVLLVVAVLVALTGSALVFVYVHGADGRAQQQFATVDVLEATAPIAAGESIAAAESGGKLALEKVPRNELLTGAQTDTESLTGQVALNPIYPGEQIISAKFGQLASVQSALQIPAGMMASSVNLTDPGRVAGFVEPGSQVAVFMSGTGTDGQPFTRLLLGRVTVLGVGSTTPVAAPTTDQTGGSTTDQLPRTIMTLALTQAEVEKVQYAAGNGELAFALLTDKSTVQRDQGVTSDSLFQ